MLARTILGAAAVAAALALTSLPSAYGQDRATQVRGDKQAVEGEGYWVYNDLELGIAEARKSARPLLVVFR